MITLITGVPGAGKTLNTLELVVTECGKREVYYSGIPELKLPWHEIDIDAVIKWWDLPIGAVIVIDEAQRIWPNVPSNKESPESVMRLDQHRKPGYDFYVITQNPTLVDFRLRKFVNRHLHFERGFGREGTRQLEWQECIPDPSDYHARQKAQIKRIKFNKKYYELYKSAEVHTFKPRVPKTAYFMVLALLAVLGLGYYLVNSISNRMEPDAVALNESEPASLSFLPSDPASHAEKKTMTTEEYIQSYSERIHDLPWSAPAFDEVTKVKSYPRPQCIYSHRSDECRCYTQQVSLLDISQDQCLNIVHNGYFDPFRADREEGEAGRGQALPARSPEPSLQPFPDPERSPIIVIPDTPLSPRRDLGESTSQRPSSWRSAS